MAVIIIDKDWLAEDEKEGCLKLKTREVNSFISA